MNEETKLFIVPTPIGNLKDITFRSIETMKKSDYILCEDTRVSKKLLNHYKINKPLKIYHAHNEHKVFSKYIHDMKLGKKNLFSFGCWNTFNIRSRLFVSERS